jgi:hypothetical protein
MKQINQFALTLSKLDADPTRCLKLLAEPAHYRFNFDPVWPSGGQRNIETGDSIASGGDSHLGQVFAVKTTPTLD